MKNDQKIWLVRALAVFFIFMLVFTVISRAADSIMIPKVQVEKAAPGSLEYSAEGKGTITSKKNFLVDVPKGYKVDKILKPGTVVEAGQAILGFKLSDIEEQKEIKEGELKKLELSLETEKFAGKPSAKTPEQDLAAQNLDLARKNAEEAQQKIEDAKNDYDTAMNQKNQEDVNARAEAQAARDQASGEEMEPAEQAYQAALKQIEQENRSFEEGQRAKYDAAVENSNAMQDDLERAQDAMDIAQKNDENTKKNDQNAQNISKNNQESIQVDIEKMQKEIQKMEELLENEGEIKAETRGVIVKMEAEAGSMTTGEEKVEVGTGQFQFVGGLSKENSEMVKTGDQVLLSLPGEKSDVLGKISDITMALNEEEEGSIKENGGGGAQTDYATFAVDLEEGEYRLGSSGSFKISVSSGEKYSSLVPVSAVRQEDGGRTYYCLAVEKKSTVLGEQEVAVKKVVEYIAASDKYVAVSNISSDDQIIIGSNKEIKEGDRVRIT